MPSIITDDLPPNLASIKPTNILPKIKIPDIIPKHVEPPTPVVSAPVSYPNNYLLSKTNPELVSESKNYQCSITTSEGLKLSWNVNSKISS